MWRTRARFPFIDLLSVLILKTAGKRVKFDQWMRALDKNHVMPDLEEGETIFEYYVNLATFEWEK